MNMREVTLERSLLPAVPLHYLDVGASRLKTEVKP